MTAFGKKNWKAGISVFHCVDYCHMRGEFEGKDKESVEILYKQLIRYMKNFSSGAAAVLSMPERDFNEFKKQGWGCQWEFGAYTTYMDQCIAMLRRIARDLGNNQVSFAIESGHKDMGELGRFLKGMHAAPGVYSFHNKRDLRLLQTADILAYEMAKHFKDKAKRKPRKSLEVLVENDPNMKVKILGTATLQEMFERHVDAGLHSVGHA